MKFGLLGEHLGHSYSPQIHKMLGGYDYGLFEVAPDELEQFLRKADFDGINVTIPYKKAVIPYCAELSPEAAKIGSVNTITKLPDGTLRGDNTDYHGFLGLIEHSGIEVKGKKCLVLGNGGVAPTVRAALCESGASEVVTISRNGEDNYDNISRHADADIIVNTTPLGMYPKNGSAAVSLSLFPTCIGVLDLIYNPALTAILLDARERGISHAGGLYMLVKQAACACERFLGTKVSEEAVLSVFKQIESQMLNVALIGMPGCGKSTTGRALAELTGRKLIDIDDAITERIGCTIPEFFAANGEAEFRRVETEVLSDMAKLSGAIIACGGGVVTRSENYRLLRQNSRIVFLERDIEDLPTDGRPVSQANPLAELAKKRLPLYNSWCDIKLCASSPEDAAQKIREALDI